MTENELFIKQKSTLIRKNSLKSFITKALSEKSIESEVEEDYIYSSYYIYNFSYLFRLKIVLVEGVNGIVTIPDSCTLDELRQFTTLEKTTGHERINSFIDLCKLSNFDFRIYYDLKNIYNDVENKITNLGKGIFTIKDSQIHEQKMLFLLGFKNDLSLGFRVYYDEHKEFIKAVKDFVKSMEGKVFKDYLELYQHVDKSSLRDFWIITKKVLRLWIRDKKNNEIHFEHLTRNLQKNLFKNNTELEHVILPHGMREIPFRLFAHCKNLKSVTIPESVEIIGREAFFDCPRLSFINIPKNLRKISDYSFAYCDSLVDLPSYIPHCEISKTAFISNWIR